MGNLSANEIDAEDVVRAISEGRRPFSMQSTLPDHNNALKEKEGWEADGGYDV
jgi:hypothetical protein